MPNRTAPRASARVHHGSSLKILALMLVAFLVAGGIALAQNSTTETRSCTVTGKDMTHKAGTGDQPGRNIYQVYTQGCGTLRVEDNLLQGVFNAADVYGSMQPGARYRITTVGWRIPWLSQFPTITKVEN